MVAVFNKELLSWYLITLKLNQTLDNRLQNAQTPPPSTATRAIEFEELQKEQNQPASPSLQVGIKNKNKPFKEFPKSPESEWAINIREKLDQAKQEDDSGSWSKLSIYRVPLSLRKDGDDKAYLPQLVSLGPYHRGKRRLKNMDRHKWRAVYHTLNRTNQEVKSYLDAIRAVEEKARASYDGSINLSSNEFVETMVLDGCFVLELFQGAAGGFKDLGYGRNDPVFAMRGSMHSIQRDMIMLENQIPLFVLDTLYSIQSGDLDPKGGVVANLAVRFFDPLMPSDEPLTKSGMNRLGKSFDPLTDLAGLHCLDVFRRSLLRTGPKPTPKFGIKKWSNNNRVADKRRQQLIHCVSELREAGIKFKRRKTDRFWDIKFKNGYLKIPRLLIHDGTKSLFLNLIAFEQCHLDSSNDITSYVIFMDNLINSPGDVSYLHYFGIIEHWLGSDAEVAELFNRLCQEVVFDVNDSYLSRLSEQINRYYDHRWNAWRAALKHKYFNNPWAIISFFAAVVLLVLTFAQTFYGVYGYYNPIS
ncbi:unnamed protein product [Cuscuta epithymum]|uniref:Uncharacterized protein n=1 Tax=Cuscuta epithymum TaxID=186058 RepID=A0AAV0D4E7_9ASTE|nr:unnamed protein product [Cuscuta epithymum]